MFRVQLLMIKAFFLIFEPSVAWERVAQSRRGMAFILFLFLLPMLLIVAGVLHLVGGDVWLSSLMLLQ